jgi:hypothetical protein
MRASPFSTQTQGKEPPSPSPSSTNHQQFEPKCRTISDDISYLELSISAGVPVIGNLTIISGPCRSTRSPKQSEAKDPTETPAWVCGHRGGREQEGFLSGERVTIWTVGFASLFRVVRGS